MELFYMICDTIDAPKSLISVLQKFGYGGRFIPMTEVAFSNIQSKIKINGLI